MQRPTTVSRLALSAGRALFGFTVAAACLAGGVARGGTVYWDGVSAGWDSLANWSTASGATTPNPLAVPGAADDLIFNITTANVDQTISLNADQAALSITINNVNKTTTFQGNTTASANRTLAIGSGGLTIAATSANVTIGSSTANQNVNLTGSSFITKLGSSTLTLRGNNSGFSGPVYIKAGTVSGLTNASAFGTGTIYIGDSTVGADAGMNTSLTIANAIVVNGGAGTRTIANFSGQSAAFTNTVTINKDTTLTFNNSGLLRFLNSVTGTGNLSINISGTSANGVQFGDTGTGGGVINVDGTITINASTAPAGTGSPISIQGGAYLGANVDGIVQNNAYHILYLKTSNTRAGNQFAGTVTVNTGTVRVEHAQAVNAANAVTIGSTGTLGITNVDPTIAGLNGVAGALVNLQTGSTARTLTLGGTGGSYDYAGEITGALPANLSLAKSGTSVQTLSGIYSYGGTTTVDGGVLRVNGNHTGAGSYSINNGGTLGGAGTGNQISSATGNVTVAAGGKLAPGAEAGAVGTLRLSLVAGSLNLAGAVNATGTGALQYDVGAAADRIELAAGTLVIGSGVLEFDDFAFTSTSGLAEGQYTLIDTNATINGTLGGNLSGTIGGFAAALSLGGGGQDLVLNVSAVPEPASLALLGVGAMGLLTRRRRGR